MPACRHMVARGGTDWPTSPIGPRTISKRRLVSRNMPIATDEQTAFRMVTRQITREHIIIPSALHRDPISLVKIHRRRAEVTRAAFQERWLGEHAGFMLSKAATHIHVRRYAQLHYLHSSQDDPKGSQIDGISVLAFASVNDVEDYLVSADYEAIEAQDTDIETCSVRSQVEHSNVRTSKPRKPAEMRASAIRCLHVGRIGRSLKPFMIPNPNGIIRSP